MGTPPRIKPITASRMTEVQRAMVSFLISCVSTKASAPMESAPIRMPSSPLPWAVPTKSPAKAPAAATTGT